MIKSSSSCSVLKWRNISINNYVKYKLKIRVMQKIIDSIMLAFCAVKEIVEWIIDLVDKQKEKEKDEEPKKLE